MLISAFWRLLRDPWFKGEGKGRKWCAGQTDTHVLTHLFVADM